MSKRFAFEARIVWGDKLAPTQRTIALASYVHRFTREHVPQWARQPRPDGSPYPVQFASDADWLANTQFNVTRNGALMAADCYSRPTWPDNPELRR
jgi:hypothetical protein